MEGVDYAFSNPSPAGLYAAGKRFAMRYVGPGTAPKHLTAAERDELWAAGLSIVLLAEGVANSALGGYGLGVQHGRQAAAAAAALGAPPLPIYFAVDFDVNAAQWPVVAQYLRGAAQAVGPARVGIYGGLRAVQWAARDKVAAWFFQTYAWSNHQWYVGNHVEQYYNGASLAGGTVDLCRAVKPDFGQWTSEGGDMALTEADAQLVAHAVWYRNVNIDVGAPNVTAAKALDDAADGVGELLARPPVVAGPVDAAALKAALMDPDVLKAIAKAVNDDGAKRQQA